MILVTLGTQDKEFTRLLKKIDELIINGKIKDEVVVQAGFTKYESNNMKVFDYLPWEQFNKYIDKADYIITHAGVGTIFDCIKKNKKVIAVPRLSKFKEHNNDHQLEIVKEYSKQGFIVPCLDVEDLDKAIDNVKDFIPKKYESNNKNMVKLVDGFIEKNDSKGLISLYNKHHEIISYLIFGVLTTIVSLITYYAFTFTILNPDIPLELQTANVISWIVSVTFAYFTNRKYVFESKNKNKVKEAISFYVSRLFTLFLDMGIMFVAVTLLKGNDVIFKVISTVLVIIANYVLSKLMVFKKEK